MYSQVPLHPEMGGLWGGGVGAGERPETEFIQAGGESIKEHGAMDKPLSWGQDGVHIKRHEGVSFDAFEYITRSRQRRARMGSCGRGQYYHSGTPGRLGVVLKTSW